MASDINDYILYGIILFFVALGVALPIINDSLNEKSVTPTTDNIEDTLSIKDGNYDSLSFTTIISSILKMFFWTFGDLPIIMDIIFIPIRLIGLICALHKANEIIPFT